MKITSYNLHGRLLLIFESRGPQPTRYSIFAEAFFLIPSILESASRFKGDHEPSFPPLRVTQVSSSLAGGRLGKATNRDAAKRLLTCQAPLPTHSAQTIENKAKASTFQLQIDSPHRVTLKTLEAKPPSRFNLAPHVWAITWETRLQPSRSLAANETECA